MTVWVSKKNGNLNTCAVGYETGVPVREANIVILWNFSFERASEHEVYMNIDRLNLS